MQARKIQSRSCKSSRLSALLKRIHASSLILGHLPGLLEAVVRVPVKRYAQVVATSDTRYAAAGLPPPPTHTYTHARTRCSESTARLTNVVPGPGFCTTYVNNEDSALDSSPHQLAHMLFQQHGLIQLLQVCPRS